MTTLVVGANGATGRLLVRQLLERGQHVRIIVRSTANLPNEIFDHDNLSVIHGSILDISATDLARHVSACRAVVSCLGHNLDFKGLFGSPRRLVTDARSRRLPWRSAHRRRQQTETGIASSANYDPIKPADLTGIAVDFDCRSPHAILVIGGRLDERAPRDRVNRHSM